MNYVKVTVNSQDYYLLKQENGTWLFTLRKPNLNGESPTVIPVTIDGDNFTIETNDEKLIYAISNLIQYSQSTYGMRMLSYYPEVIKTLLEFQALTSASGFEIDFLRSELKLSIDDYFLTTMGEERIVEWERFLGISPSEDDTLDDRREVIIAKFRGGYKLNTASINNIVDVFTQGKAISYIKDSCLYVKILPPPNNKQYKFSNVENELTRRVPAHLKIDVSRNYSTWGEIKNNFTSWQDLKESNTSWEDVMLYIAPSS